jgi:hypothetical protein
VIVQGERAAVEQPDRLVRQRAAEVDRKIRHDGGQLAAVQLVQELRTVDERRLHGLPLAPRPRAARLLELRSAMIGGMPLPIKISGLQMPLRDGPYRTQAPLVRRFHARVLIYAHSAIC